MTFDLAVNQPTAVVLAALAGALGAVLAQVVTSLFTSRREVRRLRWEMENAEQQRFTDKRLEAFSSWLAAIRQFRADVEYVVRDPEDRWYLVREVAPLDKSPCTKSFEKHVLQEVMEAYQAIRLLAPVAFPAVEKQFQRYDQVATQLDIFLNQSQPELARQKWEDLQPELKGLGADMREAMRTALGVGPAKG